MTEHAEKQNLPAPTDEDAPPPEATPGDSDLIDQGHAPIPNTPSQVAP